MWVPEGQNRGGGIPSLNINVDKEAEDPAMVGGAAAQGADPVPWAAWQEQDGNVNGAGNHPQIFVSKGVKQAAGGQPCAGFKPSANASVGAFCWQQVGLDRLAKAGGASPAGDPTLNIDPSRNGIEPDDAFTGPADTVAWVVWYETGPSAIGLRANEQVFAAKIVADPAADGGFHWQAVGNGTATQTNVLDTSGPSQFGACAASVPAADACSLNTAPAQDAEDRRVAAGTLTPGSPTVPWVVWAEDTGGGRHAIFVSRLVGGTHFELFNGGNPLSNPANDATCPGGAPNAPFATFTRAGAPQALFAQAVGPCVVILGCQGAGTASQGQVFVRARLGRRAPVGILVQRIVRQRRVHGRTVRTLRPVGRVPFGERAKGVLRVRWKLRVNGRRLRPGRDLVTLRAFSARGPRRVVAHAQPVVVRIGR